MTDQFSSDRRYRYTLWRKVPVAFDFEAKRWGRQAGSYVQFIGLNPSTADEVTNDPTLRRCIGFASAWGFGQMCMTNLFAWRETDSTRLRSVEDPVGRGNDRWLLEVASNAELVVAAWGTKGGIKRRDETIQELIPNLYCIRQTKDGHPEHPLYLPKSLCPIPFQ